jgi:hypothetical protein
MPSDTSNSGIYVVEGPARGQPIAVADDSVTAFIGPAPRGPVDHAVAIATPEEFTRIFGSPECHCRLELALRQFFSNGGSNAVVVRVSVTNVRNRVHLPMQHGHLLLEARNPGPLEYLRASVDYDGIDAEDTASFNLVIQRLRSPGSAWIDAQEYYRRVSMDSGSRDFLGYLLEQSDLITLAGELPADRPADRPTDRPKCTLKPLTAGQAGYIDTLAECINSPPPTDYDLIGSAALGTGLNALEHLPDIGQIVMLAGAEGAALGPVAMLAADRFCRKHQTILIVDPPSRWLTVTDVIRDQERSGFASANAITWFPGVSTRNLQGEKVLTSAAGAVAAALLAAERPDGVQRLHAPNNGKGAVMLRNGLRLCSQADENDVLRLSRAGINTLTQPNAVHLQLRGSVTQARYSNISSECNELQFQQRILFILRRIRSGTRWTFFHECTPEVWDELSAQINEFLIDLHSRSMLSGETASQAFFVKCDKDTNYEYTGMLGEISFIVGFSIKPGEMRSYRFQRSKGYCRVVELGWLSGLELAG